MALTTLGLITIVTTWSLAGIGAVLVLVRLLLILCKRATWGWEYFWIVISTALSIGLQFQIDKVIALGAGLHLIEIIETDLNNLLPILHLFFTMTMIGSATVCGAKIAVVALLWDMDPPGPSKWWKRSLVGVTVALVLLAITQIISLIESSKLFDTLVGVLNNQDSPTVKGSFYLSYAFGCFSALVDLYLTIYPAILLFKEKRPMSTMVLGMGPIVLGAIPIAAAVFRTRVFTQLKGGSDLTFNIAKILIAYGAEYSSTAVLVSSVPIGEAFLSMIRKEEPAPMNISGPLMAGTTWEHSKEIELELDMKRALYTKNAYHPEWDFSSRHAAPRAFV